jgi:hypothetical protein
MHSNEQRWHKLTFHGAKELLTLQEGRRKEAENQNRVLAHFVNIEEWYRDVKPGFDAIVSEECSGKDLFAKGQHSGRVGNKCNQNEERFVLRQKQDCMR